MPDSSGIHDFIARHAKLYDPASDDYDRPPFASDIKEGKNDPIYNVHSYHTKVPPRSIVPYILHYTQPGDLVFDPFCGSGMSGVAAQMCAHPPMDILEQFPELKDRVGPRACILNDLSPAACHIAYNYNTLVNVEALRCEFERIKSAVHDEFAWLYGTEHYEPAIGPYASEALARHGELLSGTDSAIQKWTLLSRAEVEERLGYPVTNLPRDPDWNNADLVNIDRWVRIPAIIHYTIWASVFKCEGFVIDMVATGRISTRGKNAGKPIFERKQVERGCRREFSLWRAGVDHTNGEVLDTFACPYCGQPWTADNATFLRHDPEENIYSFLGYQANSTNKQRVHRRKRRIARIELSRIAEIDEAPNPYWYPQTSLVPGEQGNPFLNRGIDSLDKVYTRRNLRALARLWNEFSQIDDSRLCSALKFLFTSVSVGICSRMTRYSFGKRGNGAMAMRLFIPHYQAEANVLKVISGKVDDIIGYYSRSNFVDGSTLIMTNPAQQLTELPNNSVDFIFADPPFGRNIAYAELNILWEGWLKQTTDVSKEAITSNGRKLGVESYSEKMVEAFSEMFRILKPGRYALIEFNNGDPALGLFEIIKQAILSAGFVIRNMMILDKQHKSYNQAVGMIRGEDTVDKDVVFNLRKPAIERIERSAPDQDLEEQIAAVVREHLRTLPERIKSDPEKYGQEHRMTGTINSILMSALVPRGVNVERLNLPFIERVCGRFFRKVGQHWYLRGEAARGASHGELLEEEIEIKNELSAIDWLRQKLQIGPKLTGELKPHWMRAIGLLPAEISQELVLEDLLVENFWRDADTNRWREPTPEEREKMNDDRSLRVLHDAERFVNGTLRRPTTDAERAGWIDVLFQACRAVEDEAEALPALRGFDPVEAYRLITRLFQGILCDHLTGDAWRKVEKQAGAASRRITFRANEQKLKAVKARGPDGGQEDFDFGKA